jgi:glutaredoxin-like protein
VEQILTEDIRTQVREVFTRLKEPVEILFFGRQENCDFCEPARQLAEEVAGLSDLLHFSAYDLDGDSQLAKTYQVDKAPGIVIAGRDGDRIVDYGVRYAGIPSGHEFTSLVHDLILVSARDSGLSTQTRDLLKKVNEPITLQVFVTPTCPYCPRAVVLAHQMALESPFIQAEMVEAMEFPELSEEHGVSGVPQTTINSGAGTVVGAVPEDYLLAEILRVVNGKPSKERS